MGAYVRYTLTSHGMSACRSSPLGLHRRVVGPALIRRRWLGVTALIFTVSTKRHGRTAVTENPRAGALGEQIHETGLLQSRLSGSARESWAASGAVCSPAYGKPAAYHMEQSSAPDLVFFRGPWGRRVPPGLEEFMLRSPETVFIESIMATETSDHIASLC